MRCIILCFIILVILIQYPLWLGKGGWLHVWEFKKQIQQIQHKNIAFKIRNLKLQLEIEDLKYGMNLIEEYARHELGMIKKNEKFITIINK